MTDDDDDPLTEVLRDSVGVYQRAADRLREPHTYVNALKCLILIIRLEAIAQALKEQIDDRQKRSVQDAGAAAGSNGGPATDSNRAN